MQTLQWLNFVLWHPTTIAVVANLLIVIAASVRVIMQRPAVGVALAWLVLIGFLPGVGILLYLLIGERRVGRARIRGIESLRIDFAKIAEAAIEKGLTDVDWSRHSAAVRGMDRLGTRMVGSPTVHGSSCEMYADTEQILTAIAADIDAATQSVLMEFYIWNEGGLADSILEAVIECRLRGVSCRLLIDAIGARPWWKGQQPARLRVAGVDVRPALPVGMFRALVDRTDLRLHRKIVVIDGTAAWTGSMNLVDPRYFKQDADVGEWVDAMVRLQGAVVVPLAATMAGDWVLESNESLEEVIQCAGLRLVEPEGEADIQVIPSGPGESGDALLQMILTLIHSAQEELVMTTPYLVPDEALLRAIRGAAGRGVNVRLIVPERVDSLLTRHASHSYFEDLLETGVEIYLYRNGLLHTKSIMADNKTAMFGTVNLDMRSFWLNYEVSLFVYDTEFAQELARFQTAYQRDSMRLDGDQWKCRPFGQRLLENTLRLVSPLL